jgi:Tfp pilus assembly protein PilX
MKQRHRNSQSGIAMLIVIIALLLVTAVAAGMMIYSTSEVKVDANYRDEQVALFAAKAGLEEARDRMLANNANPLTLPVVLPGQSGGSYATYIVSSSSVKPWTSGNSIYNVPTFDSEFMCEMGSCTGTSFPNSSTCCNSVGARESETQCNP